MTISARNIMVERIICSYLVGCTALNLASMICANIGLHIIIPISTMTRDAAMTASEKTLPSSSGTLSGIKLLFSFSLFFFKTKYLIIKYSIIITENSKENQVMNKPVMIITGGSSGLGLGITKAALENGYFVVNLSKNPDKIKKLEKQFPDSYMGIPGDLTDESHVKNAIAKIAEMGRISVLINSAERGCFRNPTEYTSADIDLSLEGIRSMILCTTYTLKACGEKDLRIINILSSAALKGKPKEALYCAAKWGERGYTEALKAAYSGSSVKVSAVFPSGMNTGFWDNSRDYISESKSSSFMDPDEVGKVIVSGLNAGSTLTIGDMIIERN